MIFESVVKLIAARLECDPAEITMESKFHDLGIDSLDTVDLLMELEDEIDMEVELDQKVETVGDLVNLIEAKRLEQEQ